MEQQAALAAPVMTAQEVADRLGVSRTIVYRACASGRIKAIRPSGGQGKWLILREPFEEMLMGKTLN